MSLARPAAHGQPRLSARIVGTLLLWSCSVIGLAAQQRAPEPAAGPALEQRDLAYALVSPAQKLDLFLPAAGTGPFPLVVWVHGGAWSGGDKRLQPDGAQRRVLERGYALRASTIG